MRRFVFTAGIALALVLPGYTALSISTAIPVEAAVIPQTGAAGALAIAQSMAAPATNVTGASFVAQPGGTPDGTSTTPLGGFPTDGSSFGILTSGDVNSVPNTNLFANTNDGGGNVRGNTDFDVSILKVDLNVPAGSNCLTFDFKFLSEEYPGFVSTAFNDAFIAELDNSTWTTSGSTISAPNNFAFDSSHNVVSINSTGLGGMTAANGAGTAFNGAQSYNANGFGPPGNAGGATQLLHASTQVTSGAHSVYFSIFDQGDHLLDSAVFLDNLVTGFVPNPGVNCVPGATPENFKLSLTPATATNPTGTPHTVTATLTNTAGTPVTGQPVIFTVTGANTTGGTVNTDANGQAQFTYIGTNVGTDQINACYQPSGSPPCAATASVTKIWTDPLISATGVNVSATEGSAFNGTVATFTDPDTAAVAAEYTATITWGDGNTSPGTITGGAGSFTVSGTNTYLEEGSYPVSVTITDVDTTTNSQIVGSMATVADAALSATGVTLNSTNPVNGVVANFADADPNGTASDYTATIDWGDGTPASAGTIGGSGPFTVSGTHTYAALGPYTVTTKICDVGGSCATATSQLLVFAFSSGGSFVVGTGSDTGNVTFWSAQWSGDNTLGGSPAAFKGFETSVTTPTCGGNWTSGTGNSVSPPATIPSYMAVIVSTHITQSGSTISGDISKVVIVKTDPGYSPNPGHAGTGTVVATLC